MSIVKDSTKLREALIARFVELYPSNAKHGFKAESVIKDAAERDFKITNSALSRYISTDKTSSLSEVQLIWLSYRYGIPIKLNIGVPVIRDKKLEYEIPPFNENESLKQLKTIFG